MQERLHRSGTPPSGRRELSDLDVNSMLLFYEVVNSGSINQATSLLGVPKSTISRKLRRLEQHVGSVLLKRGQQLAMTASGEILYQHCEKILLEAQSARAALSDMQTELSGRLRVATAYGLAPWIHQAVAAFAMKYPRVELVVDQTHRWIDVSEEPYDLVIHLGQIRNEHLPVRRFTELARGVYASPEYLRTSPPLKAPSDLLRHSCLVTSWQLDDGLWSFREPLAKGVSTVKPRARLSDILIARDVALAGVGIAMLPHAICGQDVASGRLVEVLNTWHIPPLTPSATYLERRYTPLRVRAFLDTVAAQFKQGPLSNWEFPTPTARESGEAPARRSGG